MKKLLAFLMCGFIFLMTLQVSMAADQTGAGPPGISVESHQAVIVDNQAAFILSDQYAVELSANEVSWPPGETATLNAEYNSAYWIGQYSMGNRCNNTLDPKLTIDKPDLYTWYFTALSKAG